MVDTRCSFQEGWTLSIVSTSCHFLSGLVYDTVHQQPTPFGGNTRCTFKYHRFYYNSHGKVCTFDFIEPKEACNPLPCSLGCQHNVFGTQ